MSKDNAKICAILSYLLVGIIWYLADEEMKKNALAKYHAKQALNLLIISVIVWAVLGIFGTLFSIITFGFGALLLAPILLIINLFFLVIWIVGIVNAVNSKLKPVPVLGQFADKYLKF